MDASCCIVSCYVFAVCVEILPINFYCCTEVFLGLAMNSGVMRGRATPYLPGLYPLRNLLYLIFVLFSVVKIHRNDIYVSKLSWSLGRAHGEYPQCY